jgi:putative membrane protein
MSHAHHPIVGSLWIFVALSLIAIAYLDRWMRVAWLVPDGVKTWRAWSFYLGMLLLWMGLGSSLSVLDHDLLTAHMVQHLLLMTLAPPLILLGAPLKLMPRLVQEVAELTAPVRRLSRSVLHPMVGWIAATAVLVVWHIPSVFMLGLRSPMWHAVEESSFLISGLLFWRPVVSPSSNTFKWPESSILLYLFLATLPCDILSGFLVFCDRVVYPVYSSSASASRFGLTALEDQQCAGALMWTCVTLVYLIAGSVFATRLLSSHLSANDPSPKPQPQTIAAAHRDAQTIEAY